MSDASWDIVVWKGENAIDFVPSSWANTTHTEYKYPCGLSAAARSNLIYKCQDLESKFMWCKAVLKKENITNLQKAKRLCKKGQETSTLETSSCSEDEVVVARKRARKVPSRFLEEREEQDEEDDEQNEEIEKEPRSRGGINANDDTLIPKRCFPIPSNVGPQCSSPNQRPSPSQCSSPALEILGQRAISSQNSSLGNLTGGKCHDGDHLAADKKQLVSITFELKAINEKLNRLENLIVTKLSSSATVASFSCANNAFELPVTSSEDLKDLNETVKNNTEKMNDLTHFLFLLGGDDPHKTIYLIMGKLIDKELALQYSGIGKKKKLPFLDLKYICKAIYAAVRKRFTWATDQAMRKSMALYLATAKSRLPK